MIRARTLAALGVIALLVAIISIVILLRDSTGEALGEEASGPLSGIPAPAIPGEGLNFLDLFRMNGRFLAQGSNTEPAGVLNLKTYRIEELVLPEPVEVQIMGRQESTQTAIRFSVTGGPFPVRALPPVIWIGDVPLEHVQENVDLTELTTIIFDRSILKEGVTISVSYGTKGDSLSTLPEKLSLGSNAD